MNADEAAAYVNSLAFKPGWQPIANRRSGHTIHITFLIDTVDTSYPDADGVCRSRPIKMWGDDKMLDVTSMSREDLCYELIQLAAQTDQHENREFLKERRDGQWVAPLHPHTREGNRAWEKRQDKFAVDRFMQLLEG